MKTLSTAFSIANRTALLGWLVLVIYPVLPDHIERFVLTLIILMLCCAYCYFILLGKRHDEHGHSPKGNFFHLSGVISLFKSPRAVLAGWIHYLAFDLMVGLYIVTDAMARGIPHWWLLPALFLTLMFGPAGLLCYVVLRHFAVTDFSAGGML